MRIQLELSFALKATACRHRTRGFSVTEGVGDEKAVKVMYEESEVSGGEV